MTELIVGWILGASMAVLFLHFTKRLNARQPETYTGASNVGAVGIDLGNNNSAKPHRHYKLLLKQVGIEL